MSRLALTCLVWLGWASTALGRTPEAPAGPAGVAVTEKLGERLPLALAFTDSEGRRRQLSELVSGDKPVLLTLVYYRCQSLCHLVLGGLVKAARGSGLSLGSDFEAVTVSIDERETAAEAKERRRGFLQALGVEEARSGWSFLVGEEAQVRALADAVGFGFRRDPATQELQHPAVAFVLTPDGRVARYLYGVTFSPRELRWSLVEASGGRVGTTLDRVLLTCMKYDPAARRYAPYAAAFLRGGGLLVFAALATTLGVLWRRELRRGRC